MTHNSSDVPLRFYEILITFTYSFSVYYLNVFEILHKTTAIAFFFEKKILATRVRLEPSPIIHVFFFLYFTFLDSRQDILWKFALAGGGLVRLVGRGGWYMEGVTFLIIWKFNYGPSFLCTRLCGSACYRPMMMRETFADNEMKFVKESLVFSFENI